MLRKPPFPQTAPSGWWTTRRFAIILVLLALVPLLLPSMPPLIDLPGHLGRYRVQLDLGTSDYLWRYFDFRWAVMGNLGVDLLVEALAPLLGLEPALKLVVLSIPATTVLGLLLIAREVHGRVPPTAIFALPLAYCFPVQFGFINFALSMGWALTAFGFWLRFARLGRLRLRAALFVPVGAAIWLAHGFGWGVLGLLAFSAEIVRARAAGRRIIPAVFHAAIQCLPLAPPVLLMVVWRSDGSGGTGDWVNWQAKLLWLGSILRERWMIYDLVSASILFLLIIAAAAGYRIGMNMTLGVAALILFAAYWALPRVLFGSAYADMRLAPYVVAIALVALTPGDLKRRGLNLLAVAGTGFFLLRILTGTINAYDYGRAVDHQLEALDHVPRGSRVLALIEKTCGMPWALSRMDHLGGYATARREAFVNDQWEMPGAQLLRVIYREGGRNFTSDPTELIRAPGCRFRSRLSLDEALNEFPRNAFDYVWMMDLPDWRWPEDPADLVKVWDGGAGSSGVLYRVVPGKPGSATTASETPNGKDPRPTQ